VALHVAAAAAAVQHTAQASTTGAVAGHARKGWIRMQAASIHHHGGNHRIRLGKVAMTLSQSENDVGGMSLT